MDRRSHAPRRAGRSRRGGEQALKRLPGKEATLCLAQICVRSVSPDPQICQLANRTGGLEPLQTQRAGGAGSDLSTIDHVIQFYRARSLLLRMSDSVPSGSKPQAR